MASLTRAIKDIALEPIRENVGLVTGQIVFYDNVTNRAEVKYDDPSNGGVVSAKGVPVEIASLGVSSSGPFPGDQVYIAFLNNNPALPRIIGRADLDYKYYSRELYEHGRSGSQLSLSYGGITAGLTNAFTDSPPIPTYQQWLTVGDKEATARNIALNAFSASAFEDQSSSLTNYELAEIGLTHPGTASTVKLYNNGVIDIFATTDLGMRVDPNGSNLMFNSMNELHSSTSCSFQVSSNMGINCGSTFSLSAGEINENSTSGHTISTNRFAAAGAAYCGLSGGEGELRFSTLKVTSASETKMILNGTTMSMNGTRLSAKMDTFNLSGTSHTANFTDYAINADHFTINASKQDENFGDYQLCADTMSFKANKFYQEVSGSMSTIVDGAYTMSGKTIRINGVDKVTVNAPASSFTGDGNCKFQYGRFDVTTLNAGVLFNTATYFNVDAKSGMTFKSDGLIQMNTTSKFSINAQGLGTIAANGLEMASAKTLKLSSLGGSMTFESSSSMTLKPTTSLSLTIGSSLNAVAQTAMTFSAPSLTYQATEGVLLSGQTTRVSGEDLYLTGTNTYLNATNTTVGGDCALKKKLDVIGAVTFENTLNVKKAVTFDSTLTVKGSTTFNEDTTLTIKGDAKAKNISLSETLSVTGSSTLKSTLSVTGATTLSSTLSVSGKASLGGALEVTNAATLKSSLTVNGSTTVQNLKVNGTLTANIDNAIRSYILNNKSQVKKDLGIE